MEYRGQDERRDVELDDWDRELEAPGCETKVELREPGCRALTTR
jgi:hypothetical protein